MNHLFNSRHWYHSAKSCSVDSGKQNKFHSSFAEHSRPEFALCTIRAKSVGLLRIRNYSVPRTMAEADPDTADRRIQTFTKAEYDAFPASLS